MTMQSSIAALAVAMVMAGALTASATIVLDQVNNPTSLISGSIGAGAGFVQQQVTAGIAGQLMSFDIMPYAGNDLSGFSFFIAKGAAWNTRAHLFDFTLPNTAAAPGGWPVGYLCMRGQ